MEKLAKKDVNILTIEDPVEKTLDRINQMQVNNVAGLTFESGLRAILRQDPDIIMVGKHVMLRQLLFLYELLLLGIWLYQLYILMMLLVQL